MRWKSAWIAVWLWLAATAPCIAADGEGLSLHERVAAAEEGEVIELPAGTFELDRPLLIETPLSIVGQGVEETIIRSTATEPSVMLRVQDVDDVRLAGFTLDGAGNRHVSQGIVIANGGGHRVEDLRIRDIPERHGFGPHAIYASSDITDSRFAGIVVRDIGPSSEWGAGIRIGEGGRGNVIENCDLRNLGRGGILTTHGSTDTRISGNRVRAYGYAGPALGIEVWGSGERVVIEDNQVDHWISVDGQRRVAVRRNTITGAEDSEHLGGYGLELVNATHVVMTDNVMEGGNHIGVSVSNEARKDLAYYARNVIRQSATWGAQIQGEQGGAHRMYFYRNVFEGTQRSERSLYPGAAGHGFHFNDNAFAFVLHANRFLENAGAGIQVGGENLDRLSFIGNIIADNGGRAVTGRFHVDHLRWEANAVANNGGGDDTPASRGFGEGDVPELAIRIRGERSAGQAVAFELEGFDADCFTQILWDLGDGVPLSGSAVEHTYGREGRYRVAAIAWTEEGEAARVEAELTIEE